MKIRIGYDLGFSSSMATPSILMLSVHPSRLDDLSEPHQIGFDPPTPSRTYNDHFGNICTRIVMSPGVLHVSSHNVVCDSGLPDAVEPDAGQIPVENLPDESLEFLLGSRYCETDRLSDTAWSFFGCCRRGGHGSRAFATMCTIGLPSATLMRVRRERLGTATRRGSVFVATSPIYRLPCAAA